MRDLAILLPKDIIDRGGLKIYTTIDPRLQMIAEEAVESKLAELEALERLASSQACPNDGYGPAARRRKTDRVSLCPRCPGGHRQ